MLKIANHCHYHKKKAQELIEAIRDYATDVEVLLRIEDDSIALCSELQQQTSCFTHSFLDPKLIARTQQKNQALIKACNNKKREILSVVDLTAGWGRDSLILATHGQAVTMIEQNRLIYHCLHYLLSVAQHDSTDARYQNLQAVNQNSLEYLNADNYSMVDCLYLDPMFPAHKSTALPSKDLQILQMLTDNLDIERLFEVALSRARHRVVVKRPLHAPTLSERKPDIVYKEKTIRFDVYLTSINAGNR